RRARGARPPGGEPPTPLARHYSASFATNGWWRRHPAPRPGRTAGVRHEDRLGGRSGAAGCPLADRRIRSCHDPLVTVANGQRHIGAEPIAEAETQSFEGFRQRPPVGQRFLNRQDPPLPLTPPPPPPPPLPHHP